MDFNPDGLFKAAYVATTWEIGQGFDNYLIGLGTDLNVTGFDYLQLNAYRRSNELYSNYQLTAVWGVPFAENFYYDGFIDWSSASEGHAAEMNFTSQLKYNLGPAIGYDNRFYIGVEYAHWNNGLAYQMLTNCVNLLLKVHL